MSGCWTTATSPTWSSAAPAGAADPRLARAMETTARIGALLAAEARAGEELGELLRELLTGPPAARDAACAGLQTALRGAADGPLALVAVLPWVPGTGEDETTRASPICRASPRPA